MQKNLSALLLSLSLVGGALFALEQDIPLLPKEAKDEARIAIIDVLNFFGSPKFRFLSDKIDSDLKSELSKLFEMSDVSREGIQKSFSEILAKNGRIWQKKKDKDIQELAEKENLDYVIFFTSNFDKKKARYIGAYETLLKIYSRSRKKVFVGGYFFFRIKKSEVEFPLEKIIKKFFQKMVKLERYKKSNKKRHPVLFFAPLPEFDVLNLLTKEREILEEFFLENFDYELLDYRKFFKKHKMKPPKRGMKGIKEWALKHDVQRIIIMTEVENLIHLNAIREGERVKRVTYVLERFSFKAHKENQKIALRAIGEALVIPPKPEKSALDWENVAYEFNWNPFYQVSINSFRVINPVGGGFNFSSRLPFKTLGFNASSWFGKFFFIDTGLSGTYIFETVRNTKQLYQVYGIFGGFSYLYQLNPQLRLGAYIRCSYYLQLLPNDSRIFRGLLVPVGLEFNYLFSQHLAFNIGIGDHIFIDRSATHGIYTFLGISYLMEK